MPRTLHRAGTTRRRNEPSLRARRATLVLASAGLAACSAETGPEDVARGSQPIEELPVWTVTSDPMSVARRSAIAAPLPGGRVLVAGGKKVGAVDTGDVFFETAEVFEPQGAVFVPVATPMSSKREWHTAASFGAGEVLVVGGNGGPVATADVFVAATMSFEPAPSLAHPRSEAAAVTLDDGRVLVTGGDPGSAGAEVFDPASPGWTETGPMIAPRRLHTATLLLDGRVLVAGGRRADDGFQATETAEIFDPATGAWSEADAMGAPRLGHTATLLADGRVLVAGGSAHADIHALGELATVEIYDPSTGEWMFVQSMSIARAFHTATALENGAVLVAGGVDATSSVLRSTELFDPDPQGWVSVGLMTHGRLQHVAAPMNEGAVLVAGGEHQSSAEVYRSAANGQSCAVGRQCTSGFCVDGVCCDSACVGMCLTCALTGVEGTCAPAAPGTDPHLDCGGGGPCDDVCGEGGECAKRVGALCVEPSCTEDRTHAIEAAKCEVGGGACLVVTTDCAPYLCDERGSPAVARCLDRCASIEDCAPGFACDTDGVCRLRPDVAATDPEACAAAPGAIAAARRRAPGDGGPGRAVAWLAGLALAVSVLRRRRSAR